MLRLQAALPRDDRNGDAHRAATCRGGAELRIRRLSPNKEHAGIPFSLGLAAHLAGGVTTLCRLWRVERKDGVVTGFADHERDLAFDNLIYRAATGFTATAIEDHLGLAVSSLDVEGALSSAAITEADLHAGRYDDAAVTIWLVNCADVSERVFLRSGFLGQVSRRTLAFTAELRGLAAKLNQAAGRIQQCCKGSDFRSYMSASHIDGG